MAQMREAELLPHLKDYARARGFVDTWEEVPFFENRIDLFAYNQQTDKTLAVELKLTRWRRAYQQALLYQLCSDEVLIAVPQSTASRVELSLLSDSGIGLVSVAGDGSCQELLPPAPSRTVRAHYRNRHLSLLRG